MDSDPSSDNDSRGNAYSKRKDLTPFHGFKITVLGAVLSGVFGGLTIQLFGFRLLSSLVVVVILALAWMHFVLMPYVSRWRDKNRDRG